MEVEYSKRACKLCRQRRVKCDKTLPTCQRCLNFGEACPGYPLQQVFIDQTTRYGIVNQSQPPRDHSTTIAGQPVQGGRSASELTSLPTNHLFSVRDLDFQGLGTPLSAASSDQNAVVPYNPSVIDSISAPSQLFTPPNDSLSTHESEFFDLDIDTYYAKGNNACGFFAELEEIDSQYATPFHSYSSIRSGEPSLSPPVGQRITNVIPKEELAPLLRLFVELLAPWMDMFDIDAYFSRIVPHYAALDVLLQFALAAVAAKQAARYLGAQRTSQSARALDQIMAVYCEKDPKEWFFKAARYYDQGISSLREVLTQIPPDTTLPSNAPFKSTPDSQSGPEVSLPNVLSAISIFSFYENLDDCLSKSSQHLAGFLALVHNSHSPSPSPRAGSHLTLAANSAGRAAFWYFARKEMFAAYVHRIPPALDPETGPSWIAAGLPEPMFHSFDNRFPYKLDEYDMYAPERDPISMVYALIWLSTKVVKFVADRDRYNEFCLSMAPSLSEVGWRSETASPATHWGVLRDRLRWWYESRPQILRAYTSSDIRASGGGHNLNRTVLFASSMGAAAIQIYHFSQSLLLLNQPFEYSWTANQPSRLRTIKENAQELGFHSTEICAIAICGPALSIQRQMSHPLQLAGGYFDNAEDRNAIREVLEDAAAETSSDPEEMLGNLLALWRI